MSTTVLQTSLPLRSSWTRVCSRSLPRSVSDNSPYRVLICLVHRVTSSAGMANEPSSERLHCSCMYCCQCAQRSCSTAARRSTKASASAVPGSDLLGRLRRGLSLGVGVDRPNGPGPVAGASPAVRAWPAIPAQAVFRGDQLRTSALSRRGSDTVADDHAQPVRADGDLDPVRAVSGGGDTAGVVLPGVRHARLAGGPALARSAPIGPGHDEHGVVAAWPLRGNPDLALPSARLRAERLRGEGPGAEHAA